MDRRACRATGATVALAAVALAFLPAFTARSAPAPRGTARTAPAGRPEPSRPVSASRALKRLAAAIRGGNRKARSKALDAVARAGGAAAMERLLRLAVRVGPERDDLYWALLSGAASFVDRPGLERLGRFVAKNRSGAVARDVVFALGGNRSPHAAAALAPALARGGEDLALLAVTALSRVRSRESVDALVAALEKAVPDGSRSREPSALAEEIADALGKLTGKRLGANPVNWSGWWKRNRSRGLPAAGEEESPATAVDTLLGRRRSAFRGVEEAPRREVVVLSARYERKAKRDLDNDHIEDVLESMGVPHTVVRREEFSRFDLSRTGVLIVNCAQFHEICICPTCIPGGEKNDRLYHCTGCNRHIPFSARLSPEAIERIRKFVLAGGYLFAEDWVLQELVQKAFPKYVGAGPELAEDVVDVVPVRGRATHPYLRGVFRGGEREADSEGFELDLGIDLDDLDEKGKEGTESGLEAGAAEDRGRTIVAGSGEKVPRARLVAVGHRWQIDDESTAIHVADRARVVGLLGSAELRKAAGSDHLVAVAFRPSGRSEPGRRAARGEPGVVLVVLSHFGHQGRMSDELGLQNLLLNFLIDAHAAHPSLTRSKRPAREDR